MSKVLIQSIVTSENITTKDGKNLTKVVFMGTVDNQAPQIMETFAKVDVGQTYEGDVIEKEFAGKKVLQFKKLKTGNGFSRTTPEDRTSIERQQALICATNFAVAKVQGGESIDSEKLLKVADRFHKWIANKHDSSNEPPFGDMDVITADDINF